ncbi:MAG: RpnC/YadD family protein [Bacilli bacterium]
MYLKERDGLAALTRLEQRVENGDFAPLDRMDLAFVRFMAHPGLSDEDVLAITIDLTLRLKNRMDQNYMVALIVGLSGSVMSRADQERLKEALRMTDLVKEMLDEAEHKARQEGRQEGMERGKTEAALGMIREGLDNATIAKVTGFPEEKVEELRKQVI